MKNLQKAGGIAALTAASTYVFAMALAAAALSPMTDPSPVFESFMAFLIAHRVSVFVWHAVMYLVNGICLVVLVPALYERLRESSPRSAMIAAAFGFFWSAFVILSGLITNYGTEALIALYGKDPAGAKALKAALDTVTLGIDSSDRFTGCLWVGLSSLAAVRTGSLPKSLCIFGLAISLSGLPGTAFPALFAAAYAFGLGVIVWWIWVGIVMLGARTDGTLKAERTPGTRTEAV